jgi:retron-type reverse transcriptase
VWREIKGGREWIVDADLKDFFGSVDHEKLLTLVAQRVSDGRVLRLLRSMLTAGSYGQGRLFPTERGTPQGASDFALVEQHLTDAVRSGDEAHVNAG